MKPIQYQVVGEEDYAFAISINTSGEYHISCGIHTSDRPRIGQLTPEQEQGLQAAVDELDAPPDHPLPEDAAYAFEVMLMIGEGNDTLTYPFWEGALPEDARLSKLVRELEAL